MKIWIDTEFNEFQGELISMALCAEDGAEWYEVLDCPDPGPWVAKHVMPRLEKAAITKEQFAASLGEWLAGFQSVHLIADWPEDLAHFCRALITGPGMRIDTPKLTMEIVREDYGSELPHNALADARGMRDGWVL